MLHAAGPAARRTGQAVVLLWLALLVQAPLWLNPGYFSHDEFQWAALADVADWRALPWVSWIDFSPLQYRPLTFNLWLLLSYGCFESPQLFHAVIVIAGSVNALLLQRLVSRLAGEPAGWLACGVFLFNPFVAAVHGWVATLADLLWLGAALSIGLIVTARAASVRRVFWTTALLTSTGLLAKEAALSIVPLLALAACIARRDARWWSAAAGAVLAGAVYLALRLEPIAASSVGSAYEWHIAAVPSRWLEYQLFPWQLQRLEPVSGLSRIASGTGLLAVLMFMLLAYALARASRPLLAVWLLGGALALGPTLVLQASYSQYAYGFAAWTAACVAIAALALPARLRWLPIAPVMLMAVHAAIVQFGMHRAGVLQQAFHASLAAPLQQDEGPLRLRAVKDEWLYRRLTADIPSHAGMRIGDRIRWVADPSATHEVGADGRVRRIEPGGR